MNREAVTLICPKCEKTFRVLEDEAIKGMECLFCGYQSEVNESKTVKGDGDMLEHPSITKMNQKGYLDQVEVWGYDYHGNEVLIGESVGEDPSTGYIVLDEYESLKDYLVEVLGFTFKEVI